MSRMKVNQIIEAARFLVAYGDELEAEEGFDAAVSSLLGKAEDKISALAWVVGIISRSHGTLLSRSAENALAAERDEKRRGFLIAMRDKLTQEALELAEKEDDQETVARLQTLLDADPITQGYLLTMPSGAVDETSDYHQRRWAEQVLTVTVGDAKRLSKITEAVKSHDEPLLAARLLIRSAGDRAAYLKEMIAELTTAKKTEEDLVAKVKALAETRLKKVDGSKYTDSLGGWIRITSRNIPIAVHPDWNGKGKIKGPDPELLPDHLVKVTKEAKKKEMVTELKAREGVKLERAKLTLELEKAETDEDKAGIKAAINGLGDDAPLLGARLHLKPSSSIGTSK